MARPIVEFQSVSKVYRRGLFGRRSIGALRDVTLAVPCGSVFGILGPNRAGKTTLIKTLLSLCRPTSGTILRLGQPASDRSTLALVGYLHESPALPRYLTAQGLLEYYGALSLVPRRELATRIPKLLDEVGLGDRAAEPISTFSKGMTQRLALAQALINDPELLVLDEPTEGMDMMARKLLHNVVQRRRVRRKTTILVSHSLDDVQRLCDHLAVLRHGQVAFDGSLADLLEAPGDDRGPESLSAALEPFYAGVTT